jgi:hypothetical protein
VRGEEPELPGADEKSDVPRSDGLADVFFARLGDKAQRDQDGHKLDFANASLAELFAWCLAQLNAAHTPAPLRAGIVE